MNSARELSRQAGVLCLLLINECASTHSPDGAGLLCGVIKHLLARGSNCPKVLVATHFHDVFRQELLDPESVPISFLHMQVMFTARDGTILESVSPSHSSSRDVTASSRPSSGNRDTGLVGPREEITYLYR